MFYSNFRAEDNANPTPLVCTARLKVVKTKEFDRLPILSMSMRSCKNTLRADDGSRADLGALFQIGRLFDTPSNLSRVDNGYTGCLEMARIPGHNRHAMNERSGFDESSPIGARIWHIERGASLGHNGINRQNSPGE